MRGTGRRIWSRSGRLRQLSKYVGQEKQRQDVKDPDAFQAAQYATAYGNQVFLHAHAHVMPVESRVSVETQEICMGIPFSVFVFYRRGRLRLSVQ